MEVGQTLPHLILHNTATALTLCHHNPCLLPKPKCTDSLVSIDVLPSR